MSGVRAFFTVVGIILLIGGILFALLTLGAFPGITFPGFDFSRLVNNYTYTALGFLVLIVGILLIVLFASGRGGATAEDKLKESGSIVNFSELGEVRISFKAVENIVLAAARKITGIREVSTRIDGTEQGLVIYLRVKTVLDMPIPSLSGELQTRVRDYVQEISGATVSEIKVLVENIAQEKIQKSPR